MPSNLLTESDLREHLRAIIYAAPYYKVQARWARQYRIAASRVSDFLQGAAPTEKIVKALGAEEECGYRMNEVNDEKEISQNTLR